MSGHGRSTQDMREDHDREVLLGQTWKRYALAVGVEEDGAALSCADRGGGIRDNPVAVLALEFLARVASEMIGFKRKAHEGLEWFFLFSQLRENVGIFD